MRRVTPPEQPRLTAGEACAVVGVCFGWFIYGSLWSVAEGFASSPGTFSDSSFLSLIGTELFLGAVALSILRGRGYDLARLLPRPTWADSFAGVLLFVVAMLLWWVLAGVFTSSEHAAQPISDMMARQSVSLPMALTVSLLNGVYEETFLLGYLVRGLAERGASIALGVSALVRMLYHLYQGPIGAVSVLAYGLLVSVFYWRTRRLWPVVLAHTLVDVLAFS